MDTNLIEEGVSAAAIGWLVGGEEEEGLLLLMERVQD